MNILAVGAHPDDVEYGCGGTLAKYKKQGHKLFIALTTSGNIGSTTHPSKEAIAGVREKEQLEAAKLFGAEVHFMRFDDEELVDTPQVRRAVVNAIRWADPQIIFTHHPQDPSTDHAMTSKLVCEVLLSLRAPLVETKHPPLSGVPPVFFWETVAGVGFLPEAYVDISEELELKNEALLKHESQHAWVLLPLEDAIRTIAGFRGLQCGYRYAEGFIAHKIHTRLPAYGLLP